MIALGPISHALKSFDSHSQSERIPCDLKASSEPGKAKALAHDGRLYSARELAKRKRVEEETHVRRKVDEVVAAYAHEFTQVAAGPSGAERLALVRQRVLARQAAASS